MASPLSKPQVRPKQKEIVIVLPWFITWRWRLGLGIALDALASLSACVT
jgi:hypothetical protein